MIIIFVPKIRNKSSDGTPSFQCDSGGFESQLGARSVYKDISNLAVELTGTAKEA